MTQDERNRLDVIESKVDRVLTKLEYIEQQGRDHEERLRIVEKWKLSIPISMLLAIATIIGAIVSGRG